MYTTEQPVRGPETMNVKGVFVLQQCDNAGFTGFALTREEEEVLRVRYIVKTAK